MSLQEYLQTSTSFPLLRISVKLGTSPVILQKYHPLHVSLTTDKMCVFSLPSVELFANLLIIFTAQIPWVAEWRSMWAKIPRHSISLIFPCAQAAVQSQRWPRWSCCLGFIQKYVSLARYPHSCCYHCRQKKEEMLYLLFFLF